MSYFPPKRDFQSLSVRDLLEAREAYHAHLVVKQNVIATAIGRYFIRITDPDSAAPGREIARGVGEARTLLNSAVQPWSWPCVLVFVRHWQPQGEFARHPSEAVPPFLYLADGRVAPVCVVEAPQGQPPRSRLDRLTFPSELLGGGYPVLTDVQGEQHIGSIGCLVSDGDRTYAVTNRHVTGVAGREIYSIVGGLRQRIGVSAGRDIGRRPFETVYPGWPGSRVLANLDAGLIVLDDVNQWSAQVYGVGELDALVDMHTLTVSLDLIRCPVRALGAASGPLVGRIHALFYRYESVAGVDHVADLVIGPLDTKRPVQTLPGDSGTLWCFAPELDPSQRVDPAPPDRPRRRRPMAMQWGGQTLSAQRGAESFQFALATFLSTVCHALEVQIVPDLNVGHNEFWGKLGHFKIGAAACDLVADATLRGFLVANRERIGVADGELERKDLPKMGDSFVPLADVPDLVWKSNRVEHPQHFANMDQPGEGAFQGKTLLELTQDPANLDVRVWNAFYEALDVDVTHRGSLPFRVWQLYDEMVACVARKDTARFLATAGALAHYVGDACQPLHVSQWHHGRNEREKPVHSIYEDGMLQLRVVDFLQGLNAGLDGKRVSGTVEGGRGAAELMVDLMRATFETLSPLEIIEAFNAKDGRDRKPHMWEVLL